MQLSSSLYLHPLETLRRYCKTRKPSTVPDSEDAVIRRHHSSESSSRGLIDGGQQKFRRESKRFSYLEETNGNYMYRDRLKSFP